MMEKLDKILMHSLTKKGLVKTTTGALVCFWADKWGKGLFDSISFNNGLLKVSVKSAAASMELDIKKEELLSHLNKKIGQELVKKLRIINLS